MATSIPEVEVPEWMSTSDPALLRSWRSRAKSAHTKAITALRAAIRSGVDEAVELRRRRLVEAYTEVDQRQQRYVRYAVFTPAARSVETQWLTDVGVEYTAAMKEVDDFRAPIRAAAAAYQASKAASSFRKSSSSHRSSIATNLRMQLHQAVLAEQQAELLTKQQQCEQAQREEEDAHIRDIERARLGRAAEQDAERKRRSRELIQEQLEQEEALSLPSRLYRSPSETSTRSSRRDSVVVDQPILLADMTTTPSAQSDNVPSGSEFTTPPPRNFFSAESMLEQLPRANGPAVSSGSATPGEPNIPVSTRPPVSWFVSVGLERPQSTQSLNQSPSITSAPSGVTESARGKTFHNGPAVAQTLSQHTLDQSNAAGRYLGLSASTTVGQTMVTTSNPAVRPKTFFPSDPSALLNTNGPVFQPSASLPQYRPDDSTDLPFRTATAHLHMQPGAAYGPAIPVVSTAPPAVTTFSSSIGLQPAPLPQVPNAQAMPTVWNHYVLHHLWVMRRQAHMHSLRIRSQHRLRHHTHRTLGLGV